MDDRELATLLGEMRRYGGEEVIQRRREAAERMSSVTVPTSTPARAPDRPTARPNAAMTTRIVQPRWWAQEPVRLEGDAQTTAGVADVTVREPTRSGVQQNVMARDPRVARPARTAAEVERLTTCHNCHRADHGAAYCPFPENRICQRCSRIGHIERNCPRLHEPRPTPEEIRRRQCQNEDVVLRRISRKEASLQDLQKARAQRF